MFTSVAQANAAVIEQIRRARPHWLDVQPASSLISELNKGKTLLHAGPPMRWHPEIRSLELAAKIYQQKINVTRSSSDTCTTNSFCHHLN